MGELENYIISSDLTPILYIVMNPDAEETAQQLVERGSEAVDVVDVSGQAGSWSSDLASVGMFTPRKP